MESEKATKTYSMIGRCYNCGFERTEDVPFGQQRLGVSLCPNCGCREYRFYAPKKEGK